MPESAADPGSSGAEASVVLLPALEPSAHTAPGRDGRFARAGQFMRWSRHASARDQLRRAEVRYRTLVEQLPLVTYIDALTATASGLYVSPQIESLLGCTAREWLDDPEIFVKLLHPDDRKRILALVDHCNRTAEPFKAEYRLMRRDGKHVWVQDESLVVLDDKGQAFFTQGYLLDVTQRKEAEQRLLAEHGVARALTDSAGVAEATPKIAYVVCEAFGWQRGALWLLDREAELLRCDGVYEPRSHRRLPAPTSLRAGEGIAGSVWRRRNPIWLPEVEGANEGTYAVPVLLDQELLGVLEFSGLHRPESSIAGTIAVIAGHLAQFLERTRAEQQLRHQALHDGLTGLPNRTLFHDRLGQALERASRSGTAQAVLLMDLDGFKDVNDTLGHNSGDALLHELGHRLQSCSRRSDTVARLGGDEFGFLPDDVGAEAAGELVSRVQAALAEPFMLQGLPLEVKASIGIAVFPGDGKTVDLLLRRADVAMYVAKRTGIPFAFYDARHDHHTPARLTIVSDLRRALEQRELVVYYQPQVELATARISGVEALLRRQHQKHGLPQADDSFVAADSGWLTGELTRYVIDEALRQRQEWVRAGRELEVAANISMLNLLDPAFPAAVDALLGKWDAPAACLCLEIAEHSIVGDHRRIAAALQRLSERGLRIALDDFGAGYASLTHLRHLALHEIKIDRSFVRGMTSNRADAAIVRTTIDLASNLGLQAVADGVDTADVCAELVELGCDTAQGVHISPPLPAAELGAWLDKRSSLAA